MVATNPHNQRAAAARRARLAARAEQAARAERENAALPPGVTLRRVRSTVGLRWSDRTRYAVLDGDRALGYVTSSQSSTSRPLWSTHRRLTSPALSIHDTRADAVAAIIRGAK